jgi:hypothetical protein
VNIENQFLYYINCFTREYCLHKKTMLTLSLSSSGKTPTPQAINRGQCKLLEEIFIVVVPLISVF